MSVRAVMISTISGAEEYVWSMTARQRQQHLESEGAWGLWLRGPYWGPYLAPYSEVDRLRESGVAHGQCSV